MNKVCPNCLYLGKGKKSIIYGNFYLGVGLIIGAIINLSFNSKFFDSNTALVGYSSMLIALGMFWIISNFRGTKTCPKCGNKEMLSLNNPEAIEIIKKHDLKPGDNPPPSPETSA